MLGRMGYQKMSGGGSGAGSGASADGTTIADRLARQMVGGNTSGVMDQNNWLETKGLTFARETHAPTSDPHYSVWIPVPTGEDSVWKTLSRALSDCSTNETTRWVMYWLQFFFLGTELGGAPATSSSQGPEPHGTPSFSVSSSRSPKLYEKVLETYCICHGMVTGARPKPEDYKFLQAHTNTVSPMFDTRMVDALRQTVQDLDARARGKKPASEEETAAAAESAPEPLLFDLPPLPADNRGQPEFIAQMDAIFARFRGQIDWDGLLPEYQRWYPNPARLVRQEENDDAEARAQLRVERIGKWVARHLPDRDAFSNKRIKVKIKNASEVFVELEFNETSRERSFLSFLTKVFLR